LWERKLGSQGGKIKAATQKHVCRTEGGGRMENTRRARGEAYDEIARSGWIGDQLI